MKTLKESGFKIWPYLHTDLDRSPVTFVWWAKTPSGKSSKYIHAMTLYRLQSSGKVKQHVTGELCPVYVPTRYYGLDLDELAILTKAKTSLPKLRKGYEWQGPFLYSSFSDAPCEGYSWGKFIAMVAPQHSDGIPLGYVATVRNNGIQVALSETGVRHG